MDMKKNHPFEYYLIIVSIYEYIRNLLLVQ